MYLHNYKKAPEHEVRKWLEESIPEITPYQKSEIYNREIIRFSPFEFMKRRERVSNIFFRLSILIMPIVWTLVVTSLPLKFLFSGTWGYSEKYIGWYDQWKMNVGL